MQAKRQSIFFSFYMPQLQSTKSVYPFIVRSFSTRATPTHKSPNIRMPFFPTMRGHFISVTFRLADSKFGRQFFNYQIACSQQIYDCKIRQREVHGNGKIGKEAKY